MNCLMGSQPRRFRSSITFFSCSTNFSLPWVNASGTHCIVLRLYVTADIYW
jgi:hypothetical protein